MSTRGVWGFIIDGEEKLTYNHSDSYPSWLGSQLLEFLRKISVESLREDARKLRTVDENSKAMPEDIKQLHNFADEGVSTGDLSEWYVLLRRAQGDPEATIAAGVMTDGSGFALESLFCEWGYVIDLDQNTFEVYQGFNKEPASDGRWSGIEKNRDGYYPINLVATFPLDALPTSEEFEKTLHSAEYGEDE